MSHIPRKAQRAIDAANRARAATYATNVATVAELPIPRRLEVGKTAQSLLRLYDVFLDGRQQFLCRVADQDAGFVIRWTSGRGHKPDPHATLETVQGRVEIRRKG